MAAVETVAAIQGAIVLSRALDNPEIFLQVTERSRARLSVPPPSPSGAGG
jgi:hypothetical protein